MQDRKLASHVMAVHTAGKAPPPEEGLAPLSADLLRAYIARAKQHDPFFPEDLTGAHRRLGRRANTTKFGSVVPLRAGLPPQCIHLAQLAAQPLFPQWTSPAR